MIALSKLDWRLFLCLMGLGILGTWVPLFDLDEGAFLEATREMLNGGHWAATTLDGEPRYDKPILSYWLQAMSLTLGTWLPAWIPVELIGRLPSVTAGALWALVLGRYVRETTSKDNLGLFVALALATTLGTLVIARAATADALLNLWLALLFTDIARYLHRPNSNLQLRVFLWLALGILTKGPVAVLIPGGALMLWVLSTGQWSVVFNALKTVWGYAILLAILAPWIVGVYDAQGLAFFENFILRHNVERFSGNLHGHGGHPLYYLFVMPLMLLPYSGLVIAIMLRLKEFWGDPISRFALLWFALVVLLVSASGTQLPHYVLYSTPPLFVLYARVLPSLNARLWALPGLVLPMGLVIFGLFHHLIPMPGNQRDEEQILLLSQVLTNWWWPLSIGILTITGVAVLVLLIPRWRLSQRLIAMGGAQLTLITLVVMPVISESRQRPLKEAAMIAKDAGADVVSQGIRMPSFSFYRDAITRETPPKAGQWVLISVDRIKEIQSLGYSLEIKATGPGWRLIALNEPTPI
jgi:4-amino-4-deoxy-L-arabinose transferase-like glycosyltransferase